MPKHGKLKHSVTAFSELKLAYDEFCQAINGSRIKWEMLESLHEELFKGGRFVWLKQSPRFSKTVYPSLFEDLLVLGEARALEAASLPSRWDLSHVNRCLESQLNKLLLAFIWKQGDFNKVESVLLGIQSVASQSLANCARDDVEEQMDSDSRGNSPAVMYQFGRHLADPLNEPIFDQHTYRAYRLLSTNSSIVQTDWNTRAGLLAYFVSPVQEARRGEGSNRSKGIRKTKRDLHTRRDEALGTYRIGVLCPSRS